MRHPKYIVVKRGNFEVPIVFPDIETHADIARGCSVVSAGFCSPPDKYNPGWSCWGESVSLEVKSRLEDSSLLDKFLV